MADVRFEHSSAGYVSLMKSGEMRGVLHSYAEGITALANAMIRPDRYTPPLDKEAYAEFDFEGKDRAGVRIQTNNPHARLAEAQYGPLQNAAGV